MPLGNSRRRLGRPSSNGSLRDGLFDQLLAFLASGADPLATEEEYWAWVREWSEVHQGDAVPLLAECVPWPLRRRQALTLLGAVSWASYRRIRLAVQEDQEALTDTGEPLALASEDHLQDQWHRWRGGLMQRYRLAEGLLSAAAEGEHSPVLGGG
jgi:hypothetical protein